MKLIKKILCALIVCALVTPYTVFAEENMAYEASTTLSLFSDDTPDIQPTVEEAAFMEFLASEFAKRHTEITVPDEYNIDSSRFGEIYHYYMGNFLQNEHPELFYAGGGIRYNIGTIRTIEVSYTMTDDEIIEAEAAISAELEKIKGLISDKMTDVEKVLLVHDYIAANYEYDTDLFTNPGSESRRLDTMVMRKKGVCQGYANLFKYVMDNIGIECVNVPSNECKHVWNKVKLDDEWYNIDVTSDDPLMDLASSISHKYFLVNDNEIKQLDTHLHTAWNAYKWDNKTPVEVSESEIFSQSVVHKIPGQMVYKDGKWYGFTDSEDKNNVLSTIDVIENTVNSVYTDSSDFIWYSYGSTGSYFPTTRSSLALYKGDIYFNSPDKVYKYDIAQNSAEVIYDFAEKNPDKKDISNTYLYGIRVRDDALHIEYTTQPYTTQNEHGEIVSAKMDAIIQILPEVLPCSSTQNFNEETGEVTVSLSIPDTIESPKVMIAEFDDNGMLIGFAERNEDEFSVTFTPDAACKTIKTFIWDGINYSPLSYVSPLTIPNSSDSENSSNTDNAENTNNTEENSQE